MDSVGKLVKIEGRVSGSQPLNVTWYKDDSEIHSSDKYDISFKNNMAMLGIKGSATSDGGVYTCEASNEAGKTSCRVSLTISGMNSLFDKMRFMFVSHLSPRNPRTKSIWSLTSRSKFTSVQLLYLKWICVSVSHQELRAVTCCIFRQPANRY